MTDTDLKPCPNPWCDRPDSLLVVWDLYSRRVICQCGVKGPRSETKANTTQGVPINDGARKQAEKEAVAAWNTRPALTPSPVAVSRGAIMDLMSDSLGNGEHLDLGRAADAILSAFAAPTDQPAAEQPSPYLFNEPYSIQRKESALSGVYFRLLFHNRSIASYSVKSWGSESACIKAAWHHAYETEPAEQPDALAQAMIDEGIVKPAAEQPSVAEAARVLLSDDVALSKMAAAMHDGPLMADDHAFSAATPAGSWCLDMARAALRTLSQEQQ